MEDKIVQQKTKQWWDERASQLSDPREIVAAGKHTISAATQSHLNRLFIQLLRQVKNQTLGLDAGCGTGLYIPTLLTHFQNVWGMDFSDRVLDKAISEIKLDPRVKLFQGSITSIPLASSTLPFVFCKSTLQCISMEEVTMAIREFYRVLTPGGQAILHFKNSSTIGYRLSAIKSFLKLNVSGAKKALQDARQVSWQEAFVSGEVYFRPYGYYFHEFTKAGFTIEEFYSYQFFTWNYIRKRKISWLEKAERILRKLPLVSKIIKTDGIDFYVLLKKPQ